MRNNPEYRKQYYQKNKDKIKTYNKAYRERNIERLKIKEKEYCTKKGPERYRAAGKKYYHKIKQIVLEHYKVGSVPMCNHPDCIETDTRMLQIDHINGGGNQHRKGLTMTFYQYLVKNNFPEGYQMLCANHNVLKRVAPWE